VPSFIKQRWNIVGIFLLLFLSNKPGTGLFCIFELHALAKNSISIPKSDDSLLHMLFFSSLAVVIKDLAIYRFSLKNNASIIPI
jgi:hypothetical protein